MLKDVQIVPLADFPEAIAPMALLAIIKERDWMRVGASQSLHGEVAVYRCNIAPEAA